MAISKLILNGEVQMDVTSNTNAANNMLNGVVGTKNDGTSVTGNIASKSSTDLTISGATVTAPAGYYANAASKAVATTTHPNPTASIASSTGVVTASHTQGTGYVTSGTTTGTLNLTTQAGKTVTPTESAQTAVASYRWTTGPISVAAISSTYVGTGVAKKSSADLTASGSTVTAPAGYYSTAATKNISAGSAFSPAVTITKAPTIGVNTFGVVTASYNGSSSITPTVTSGYVSQGTAGTISTTGTSTYQLTSKAAATYYPSTADQTIASQRWLVGSQTIKSVTTSNLTAENIAEGVVVKVGDANNASRITQITGTHSGATSYTCTITGTGNFALAAVQYNPSNGSSTWYYDAATITYHKDDSFYIKAGSSDMEGSIYVNNILVSHGNDGCYYTLTPSHDFSVTLEKSKYTGSVYITIPSLDITENGNYEVAEYEYANVNVDGGETYTFTESYKAGSVNLLVKINNVLQSFPFTFHGGEVVDLACTHATGGNGYPIYIDGVQVAASSLTPIHYTWTLPKCNIDVSVDGNGARIVTDAERLSITANGTYFVDDYNYADVNVGVGGGFTVDQIATRMISGDISGNATQISSYAFYNCRSITGASFSLATTISGYAFYGCSSLSTVNFPSAQYIWVSAFYSCTALSAANFSLVKIIASNAFRNCYALTTASFPSASSIANYAFYACSKLSSLYLLGSSVVSLGGTSVFTQTQFSLSSAGMYGSIFVPSSLYNSYLTATYWSAYSACIVSV